MGNNITYECAQCGKPILLEGYYAEMMSFFNMPKRSGLCSKCVVPVNGLVPPDSEANTDSSNSPTEATQERKDSTSG